MRTEKTFIIQMSQPFPLRILKCRVSSAHTGISTGTSDSELPLSSKRALGGLGMDMPVCRRNHFDKNTFHKTSAARQLSLDRKCSKRGGRIRPLLVPGEQLKHSDLRQRFQSGVPTWIDCIDSGVAGIAPRSTTDDNGPWLISCEARENHWRCTCDSAWRRPSRG